VQVQAEATATTTPRIPVHQCTSCGKQYIQPKWLCDACRHTDFTTATITGTGTIFTHTRVHITSAEFAALAPYTVALIELNESGLKVTGRLQEAVTIGDTVQFTGTADGAFIFTKV
jgi:uncharacterized OB-fold protein